MYRSRCFKLLETFRHAGPSHPEELAQNVMRQRQPVTFESIPGNKQPPRQSLFQRVRRIAHTRLRCLEQDNIEVLQEHLSKPGEFRKNRKELMSGYPLCCPADLHYPTVGRRLILFRQQQRRTDHAFRTDQPGFNKAVLAYSRGNRDQSLLDEIDMIHRQSPVVQDLPRLDRHLLGY